MKKVFLIVFVLGVLFSCQNVFASAKEIRIGLFFDANQNAVSKDYHKFSVSSKEGFTIKKYSDEKQVENLEYNDNLIYVQKIDGQDKIVVYDDNNKFLVSKGDEQIEIIPKDGIFAINSNKSYRGCLILKNWENDKLILINKLGLEQYLYGVVVREIGSCAPIEAIKAQAVAARTYAIAHYGMYINYGFDITDKYQQVYGGYSWENDKVNLAVDETRHLVMLYDEKPIKAFYYASSGGITEGAENVWGRKEPYLVSVLDEYDLKRKDTSKWKVEFSKSQIEEILKNMGIDIGDLLDIKIEERAKSRRVIKLKFVGSKSSYTCTKNNVRTPLKLKSQLFWMEKEQDTYIFYGKGFGHGVGLSQVGAMGMADCGFGFDDILKHYFNGIKIEKYTKF